jgi:hypothetical protein
MKSSIYMPIVMFLSGFFTYIPKQLYKNTTSLTAYYIKSSFKTFISIANPFYFYIDNYNSVFTIFSYVSYETIFYMLYKVYISFPENLDILLFLYKIY